MEKFNCIIIEDDMDHSEILKFYLSKFFKEINIAGEARTISSAMEILEESKPNIVFLDLELQGQSSFEILEQSTNLENTEIIIISSHPEYALKAYEHLVTDYILKPLLLENLILAIKKAKKNIKLKMLAWSKNKDQNESPLKHLAIATVEAIDIIAVDKILYLESDGRYTVFHMEDNTSKVASKNLGEYTRLLCNNDFFRIHHSILVNMNHAINVYKKDGNYIQLSTKKFLPISKRKMPSLYNFLRLK